MTLYVRCSGKRKSIVRLTNHSVGGKLSGGQGRPHLEDNNEIFERGMRT